MSYTFNMSGVIDLAQEYQVADSEQYGLQKQSRYCFV